MMPQIWSFALGKLAAMLAFFGLRAWWVGQGVVKAETRALRRRVEAAVKGHEVENEVEALDADALRQRAAKWVRGPAKR